MKRACIIITEGQYIDGVIRTHGDDRPHDAIAHIWLEASERLLADLHTLTTECMHNGLASVRDAAARVRAATGEPEIPPRDG